MQRTASKRGQPEGLAKQLADLDGLDGKGLRERWRKLYGAQPPPGLNPALLVQAIAHRLQEKTLGGLKPSTRRLLQRIAMDAKARRATLATSTPRLKPGAVLLREWHGVTHQVTVLADGVRFRGKYYRSLSQVARMITGSRWSGPLFFGLRRAGKGA
jgi:hypothetical protein